MITTPRLELVPGTPDMLRAEFEGRAELERELGAAVPEAWPPPPYDEHAIRWMLDRLGGDDDLAEWGFRYFVLRADGTRKAVGAGEVPGEVRGAGVEP